MKVCDFELDHCNSNRTYEMLISNETVEIPAIYEMVRPKKNVVFPLTRPTQNFCSDPINFIDPLKKFLFVPNLCICNQYKDKGSSACVLRLMDTGNK
jgi:hypothetical protein